MEKALSLIVLPGADEDRSEDEWALTGIYPHEWFADTNARPLVVHARRGTEERGTWVLKPLAQLGVGESIKEMVAYRLAALLGIPVPRFGVIQVSAPVVDSLPEPFRTRMLHSLGPNFGTRLLKGVVDLVSPLEVPESHRLSGCEIFAFDAAVDNVDRRAGNSNVLVGDDGLRAIDHQHTFSWCSPTTTGPDHWDSGTIHRLLPDHVFGPVVFRWLDSFARLRTHDTTLDASVADSLTSDLPAQWLAQGGSHSRDRIRDYLVSMFGQWKPLLDHIEGGKVA